MPWAILATVLRYAVSGIDELPLSMLASVLQHAVLGLILGVIFVAIDSWIPTRHRVSKAIVFMVSVWLVGLLLTWLVITWVYVLPEKFPGPTQAQVNEYEISLIIGFMSYLLWGATFGCLFQTKALSR
jgi:hypothetical protein